MKPARRPPVARSEVRLLGVDPERGALSDRRFAELPELLEAGDTVVVNDAATLPASLRASTAAGVPFELRVQQIESPTVWRVVLFGEGDWRQPTEKRGTPPTLAAGDCLRLGNTVNATVHSVSSISRRLLTVRLECEPEAAWAALYALGVPIQYSYLREPLQLWSVQSVFAGRPWAVEMPSAGRPLDGSLLVELRRREVQVATLTHGAGLSSTGDAAIDAAMPLPERYDVPAATVKRLRRTRDRGSRVIAVGTTVVRALEGSARQNGGELRPGSGITDLIVDENYRPLVVDGLLTGMHSPAESHYRLLRAFAPETILRAAWEHASRRDYRCHEFGDLALILSTGSRRAPLRSPQV